jgi:hypothetical protein
MHAANTGQKAAEEEAGEEPTSPVEYMRQHMPLSLSTIAIRLQNGKFVVARDGDGQLFATSDEMSLVARFEINYHKGDAISLRNVMNGKHVVEEKGRFFAKAPASGDKFVMSQQDDGGIVLKSSRGKYLAVESNGHISGSKSSASAATKFRKVDIPWNPTIALMSHTGKYLIPRLRDKQLMADGEISNLLARFEIVQDRGNVGSFSLRNMMTGRCIKEDQHGRLYVTELSGGDKFSLVPQDDGTISLKNRQNKFFAAYENGEVVGSEYEASEMCFFSKVDVPANPNLPAADEKLGKTNSRSKNDKDFDDVRSRMNRTDATSPTGSRTTPNSKTPSPKGDADDLFFRKPQPKQGLWFWPFCCTEQIDDTPHPKHILHEQRPACYISETGPLGERLNRNLAQLGFWGDEIFGDRTMS